MNFNIVLVSINLSFGNVFCNSNHSVVNQLNVWQNGYSYIVCLLISYVLVYSAYSGVLIEMFRERWLAGLPVYLHLKKRLHG